MSSVEGGSDKGEDSLSEQLQIVLKNNKIQRQRHHSRGSRNSNSESSLYKEAFKEYMFGHFELASDSCKKMIASNPDNPEPYFLMATMHQEAATRNHDDTQLYKSVEYFFIHAYYSAPSVEKWLKVADMSYELELYLQAAYCYGRALKMNKSNIEISLKRAQCLQRCFQIKKAVNIYKKIIEKVSNSAEIYKRYAKLRFRREQHAKAREILMSYSGFEQDLNIKFMIAETYLKEKKFVELHDFIQKYIILKADPPITNIYDDLQLEFIQMLFICRVNCPEQTHQQLQIEPMLQFLIQKYEPEENTLYEELLAYIKKPSPELAYSLLSFLLQHLAHQTIENYLYATDYLIKIGKHQQAIRVLQAGLNNERNRNSVELKTQLNYLRTLVKSRAGNVARVAVTVSRRDPRKKTEEIYYSDDEEEIKVKDEFKEEENYAQNNSVYGQSESQQQSIPVKKLKRIKKSKSRVKAQARNHIEIKDPQIVSKLIQNSQLTLQAIQEQLQTISDSKHEIIKAIDSNYTQVEDCLRYLVEIQGQQRQTTNPESLPAARANQSIFNNKQPKKRRSILGSSRRRLNLITKNSQALTRSLKEVIFFMKQCLKIGRHEQVVHLAQLMSKGHFFNWQNRIKEFRDLKREVYEMGVLACLELETYGKSIFFLRYLLTKNPQNEFYLSLAEKVMRKSQGKLFINSIMKKNQDWKQPSGTSDLSELSLLKMHYLTGLEYMENCFFELAISMFAKVLKTVEPLIGTSSPYQQICKSVYLCICTCFLQLASSRTVFNKLDHVNRSAFCLAKYKAYTEPHEAQIVIYNEARWYSFVKLFPKAIEKYQRILQQCGDEELVKKSATNLVIIYKDLEEYDKIQAIAKKYLPRATQP